MTTTQFHLCAIPRVAWEQSQNPYGLDIIQFAADALGCERRIAKDVNLENEFERYTLTCQRLEQIVLGSGRLRQVSDRSQFQETLQASGIPVQTLTADYLALLSRVESPATWARLGASFFPPDRVNEHRHAFITWATGQGLADASVVLQRTQFFEWAEEAQCGVVETQTSFHPQESVAQEPVVQKYASVADEPEETFIDMPDFEAAGLAVEFFGARGSKQHLAKILRRQIREALATGEPITFGNQAPHDVITQVLHEYVFVPPDMIRPTQLRVAYADGSEAMPFPLFCLSSPEETDAAEISAPLRVALMSMRHQELDPKIDYCWFRNREVSRTRTLAETDQFCFAATLAQLQDSLALGNMAVHLYQTGFEPAVVGFYHGVVEILLKLRSMPSAPQLSVVPFYFRGADAYEHGSHWR